MKDNLTRIAPQARYHSNRLDQINRLIHAAEADEDIAYLARLLALCSLPRTNPGNRKEYVRTNGPFTLALTAGFDNKLPFGYIARLLLAWVCTEAVRTPSRIPILSRVPDRLASATNRKCLRSARWAWSDPKRLRFPARQLAP